MRTNERPLSESAKLRNLLRLSLPKAVVSRLDSIDGWDEMQGYPDGTYGNGDTVGLSWGDVGHGINMAINQVAQYHALQRAWGGGGNGTAQQRQPMRRLPGPPQIPANQAQAFQNGGPSKLLGYMGLGTFEFNPTSGTSTILTQEPSTAFRIRRLIVDQAKSSGATGVLVTVGAINVSGMPQSPAPNARASITGFEGGATYSLLDLQIAAPGVPVELPVFVSAAPASGETVTVSAMVYGEWLR